MEFQCIWLNPLERNIKVINQKLKTFLKELDTFLNLSSYDLCEDLKIFFEKHGHKYLQQGSSRIVFDVGDNLVLKIDHSSQIIQNKKEISIANQLTKSDKKYFAEIFKYQRGKNRWIVAEKITQLTESDYESYLLNEIFKTNENMPLFHLLINLKRNSFFPQEIFEYLIQNEPCELGIQNEIIPNAIKIYDSSDNNIQEVLKNFLNNKNIQTICEFVASLKKEIATLLNLPTIKKIRKVIKKYDLWSPDIWHKNVGFTKNKPFVILDYGI